MNKCSYFIEDKGIFGSFPSQNTVNELENYGVRVFVDLTTEGEKMTENYTTRYKYIKYPIHDRKYPTNWKSFSELIVIVNFYIDTLSKGEKIYIHCKGGHGRSGILVSSLIAYRNKIPPEEALDLCRLYHSRRPEMREKWRRIGSPQKKTQKDFVRKFFSPLKFSKPDMTGYTAGFHLQTQHPVKIGNTTFKSSYLAINYYRYGKDQYNFTETKNWETVKKKITKYITKLKFKQNESIMTSLLNTGFRPILKFSHDHFWGTGLKYTGLNIFGKILEEVRYELLTENLKIFDT